MTAKKAYTAACKNGRGKTTLVKLLVKFYRPLKGSIIINGKYDIKDVNTKEYRKRLSAVFQDFAVYAYYTIDENIFVKPAHSEIEEAEKLQNIYFLSEVFKSGLSIAYKFNRNTIRRGISFRRTETASYSLTLFYQR